MTDTIRRGREIDRLAELEEERRFLLRSLRDLEREREAGDVDDADYETLRDGYTVRAADVLRQIEDGKRSLAPAPPRRWGLVIGVSAAIVLGAVGIGLVLANAWGERGADQEITGFTPGDDVRSVLANARAAMSRGDFATANELFLVADQAELERGVDNPEARAYVGWTFALLTVSNPDEAQSSEQLDLAVLALEQAVAMDPDYPDPHCFLAIIEFQFRGDAVAALEHVEICESRNPPADIADLITGFAQEIRAAAG